jgi:hypothetical protein
MDEIDRIVAGLTEAQRAALHYHTQPDRMSSCGSMATDMSLLLSGLLDFGKDGRLELTPLGLSIRARLQERSDALPAPPQEG